jgi:hypothetical protein
MGGRHSRCFPMASLGKYGRQVMPNLMGKSSSNVPETETGAKGLANPRLSPETATRLWVVTDRRPDIARGEQAIFFVEGGWARRGLFLSLCLLSTGEGIRGRIRTYAPYRGGVSYRTLLRPADPYPYRIRM